MTTGLLEARARLVFGQAGTACCAIAALVVMSRQEASQTPGALWLLGSVPSFLGTLGLTFLLQATSSGIHAGVTRAVAISAGLVLVAEILQAFSFGLVGRGVFDVVDVAAIFIAGIVGAWSSQHIRRSLTPEAQPTRS